MTVVFWAPGEAPDPDNVRCGESLSCEGLSVVEIDGAHYCEPCLERVVRLGQTFGRAMEEVS